MFALSENCIGKLREVINQPGMWDVVSSLRGPDFCPDDIAEREVIQRLKEATTAVIRFKVFGDWYFVYGDSNPDSPERAALRIKLLEEIYDYPCVHPLGHFLMHAKDAFGALGLKWNKVNHSEKDVGRDDLDEDVS